MEGDKKQLHNFHDNIEDYLSENIMEEQFTSKSGIENFSNLYEISGFIGKGSFSRVVSGVEKETGRHCAIKVIFKKDNRQIFNEIKYS